MSSPSLRGLWNECRATMRGLERWRCCMAFFSSAFLAFGLYHVHSVSGITEGGVLGATLLLDHWFSLSPAVSGFVLNLLCYGWGWRLLGRSFIAYSLIATVGFSLPYKLYELFPPLWPQLAEMPLLAAVVGALFVGVGADFPCARAAPPAATTHSPCASRTSRAWASNGPISPPIWWCSACR